MRRISTSEATGSPSWSLPSYFIDLPFFFLNHADLKLFKIDLTWVLKAVITHIKTIIKTITNKHKLRKPY